MGLSIKALRNLQPTESRNLDEAGIYRIYRNKCFPKHATDLKGKYVHVEQEDIYRGPSITYSGYTKLRDNIARSIGWPRVTDKRIREERDKLEATLTPKEWKRDEWSIDYRFKTERENPYFSACHYEDLVDENSPLYHLIYFSDSEGWIGPKMCARIAGELREQMPQIEYDLVGCSYADDVTFIKKMLKCFEWVEKAENGAVVYT